MAETRRKAEAMLGEETESESMADRREPHPNHPPPFTREARATDRSGEDSRTPFLSTRRIRGCLLRHQGRFRGRVLLSDVERGHVSSLGGVAKQGGR